MHRRQKEPMAKAASHSGCKRDHTPVRTEESSLSLLSDKGQDGQKCSGGAASARPRASPFSHWALTQTLLPLCGRSTHTFADRAKTKQCNPSVRSSIFQKGSDCTSHPCRPVKSREVNLHLFLSSVLNYFKMFFCFFIMTVTHQINTVKF